MLLYTLPSGDQLHRFKSSIVLYLKDHRKLISTSHLNGGYREDLKAVFNFDSSVEEGEEYCQRTDTYESEMRLVASELDLDPELTTGISTVVSMANVVIKTKTYKDLTVTAIVTAGIGVNAGRVGDPASFYEEHGKVHMVEPGTINTILFIDANLLPGTLTRCIVTCTEAKTAALQELMARSMYSKGLATGSGTDETIVICNSKSNNHLTFAGKHSKLGELIGVCVISAVKEALYLQAGLDAKHQHNVFMRLGRFDIDSQRVWGKYLLTKMDAQDISEKDFLKRLELIGKNSYLVIKSSLLAHLLDQLYWLLLSPEEVGDGAKDILIQIKDKYELSVDFIVNTDSIHGTASSISEIFLDILVAIVLKVF